MSARVVIDNTADLQRALTALVRKQVMVGVPGDETMRNDGGEITNADLAYIHTYGGVIRIPEREQSIFRLVDSEGNFQRGGKFVRRAKSNFETVHAVPAHTVTIPPRPFLVPGIEKAQDKITDSLGKAAESALTGNMSGIDQSLHKAGLEAQNSVRAVINAGVAPELSENTIKARRQRGRTGTKPLVDTGQLRNSIVYVLRVK